MNPRPRLIYRGKRAYWKFQDGRVLPVISGASLPATDDFATDIDQSLTDYSANWALHQGAFRVVAADDVAGPYSAAIESGARWAADTFNDNQYSQASVYVGDPEFTDAVGVSVRGQSATNGWYGYEANGGIQILYKMLSDGTYSALTSVSAGVSYADILRIESNGTTITARLNGSTLGAPTPQTDSTYSGGYAGICGYNNNIDFFKLDNWEGGNLGGAAVLSVNIDPTVAAYQLRGVRIR